MMIRLNKCFYVISALRFLVSIHPFIEPTDCFMNLFMFFSINCREISPPHEIDDNVVVGGG